VPPFLPVLISASLKERQLRLFGKLPASSCPIEVPASYFYPPTLFPFPRSSLLSASLKISANSLLLATSSYHPSSCPSCSVDHLPCPPQGYLHCTSVKANLVKVTASALLYYRQQGQSFPSSDGAIPCRLPFEPHTPITLSLSVMNWLVPQSS
jgi:hypothetical protein